MIITDSNLILHRPLDIEDGYVVHVAIFDVQGPVQYQVWISNNHK